MKYFFILGKNPNLSIAEIRAVLGDFKIEKLNQEVLIADFEKELDLVQIIKKLGGTVKIGIIIGCLDSNLKADNLTQYLNPQDKKIFFGFSWYNLSADNGLFNKLVKNSQRLGLELKKTLKNEHQISSRLVEGKESVLSSVIVAKNKLLTRGKEFNFFVENNQILVGETTAVQDFESYGERDFGRPGRDSFSGMLPPKLAKMMINLTQADFDDKFLDPFCGSGTVIQEAILLGYKNLIGSDISDKAIADTNKNLEWLKNNTSTPASTSVSLGGSSVSGLNFDTEIFQADAQEISQKISANSISAIATEPFLGPPRFKDTDVDKIIDELSQLYIKAFEEFKKILEPGGRVVIVFPAWRVDGKVKYLPIVEKIEAMGFSRVKFENNLENESRSGLIYGRESHRIVREIWVWEN